MVEQLYLLHNYGNRSGSLHMKEQNTEFIAFSRNLFIKT